MSNVRFRLNPKLDVEQWAAAYRATGRVSITHFLVEEDARRLHSWLMVSDLWRRVLNAGDTNYEIATAAWLALPSEERSAIEAAVIASARHGFQYLYETIRVPDASAERATKGRAIDRFASFLCSAPGLEVLRRVTGRRSIAFADAQATAYAPGDFLTGHDDRVEGKDRRAAYGLGLTPAWRPEWGGLLMFHRADGHIAEALTPSFNTLNLFAVPQPHSVSMVTPFADGRRYSVTGWLRGSRSA